MFFLARGAYAHGSRIEFPLKHNIFICMVAKAESLSKQHGSTQIFLAQPTFGCSIGCISPCLVLDQTWDRMGSSHFYGCEHG
jgi:hypothetical protein